MNTTEMQICLTTIMQIVETIQNGSNCGKCIIRELLGNDPKIMKKLDNIERKLNELLKR